MSQKSSKADIRGRIMKVRRPQTKKTVKEIEESESRTNALFKSVLREAPEESAERIAYMVVHTKTEREMDTVCSMIECQIESSGAESGSAYANTAVCMLLEEIEKRKVHEKDAGCVGSMYVGIKRIMIQHWDVIDTKRVVQSMMCTGTHDTNRYALCIVMSEAWKVLQYSALRVMEIMSEQNMSEEDRSVVVSNMIMDRNNRVYFGIEKYRSMVQALTEKEVLMVCEEVQDRASTDELQKVVAYIVGATDKNAEVCNAMHKYYTCDTIVLCIENMSSSRVAEVLERLVLQNKSGVKSVIEKLSNEQCIHVTRHIVENTQKQESVSNGRSVQALIDMMQNRIEESVREMHSVYPSLTNTIMLALGYIKNASVCDVYKSMGVYTNSTENTKKAVRKILACILSTEYSTEYSESAFDAVQSSRKPESGECTMTVVEMVVQYANEKASTIQQTVLDMAFGEGIRLLVHKHDSETDNGTKCNDTSSRSAVDERSTRETEQLLSLIREEIIHSAILGVIVEMVSAEMTEQLYARMHEHTQQMKKKNIKEHAIKMEQIIAAVQTEKDARIAVQYIMAVIRRVPYMAQKKILRNSIALGMVWRSVQKEYRRYEAVVVSCIVDSNSMQQFLPHGIQKYVSAEIMEVDPEQLMYMLPYILDTPYTLQYLQIIDRTGVLRSASTHGDTKWTAKGEKGSVKMYYDNEVQPLCMPEPYRAIIQNEIRNSASDVSSASSMNSMESKSNEGWSGTVTLTHKMMVQMIKKKVMNLIEKDTIKEIAVHALLGRYIRPKEDGASSVQKLVLESEEKREIVVKYMWNRLEYKQYVGMLPELAMSYPEKAEKRAIPTVPAATKRARVEQTYTEEAEKKEKAKKVGIIAAQAATSKKNLACDVEESIRSSMDALEQEEKERAAQYFGDELVRYWRTDREKVSRNFESVMNAIHVFCTVADMTAVQHIVLEYYKCANTPVETSVYVIESIIVHAFARNTKLRSRLEEVSEIVKTDTRLTDTLCKVISKILEDNKSRNKQNNTDDQSKSVHNDENKDTANVINTDTINTNTETGTGDTDTIKTNASTESSKATPCILRSVYEYIRDNKMVCTNKLFRTGLSMLSDSTVLYQALIKCAGAIENTETYNAVLDKALSLLDTRNEELLTCVLHFVSKEYISNEQSAYAQKILASSIRCLLMRTKLDTPGTIALSVVQHAVIVQNIALSRYEKEELMCTIKYDLFHYQHVLLHYIAEMPVEEVVEIVSKINTPEARSARNNIRKALLQYTPQEKEGMAVFAKLMAQSQIGSASERMYVLDIVKDTLHKLSQGAWITLFLKTSEVLANETTQKVEEKILEVINEIIVQSRNKKQIKEIYGTWKKKQNLQPLVKKLHTVFEW